MGGKYDNGEHTHNQGGEWNVRMKVEGEIFFLYYFFFGGGRIAICDDDEVVGESCLWDSGRQGRPMWWDLFRFSVTRSLALCIFVPSLGACLCVA